MTDAEPVAWREVLDEGLFDLVELAREKRGEQWLHPRGALVGEFGNRIASLVAPPRPDASAVDDRLTPEFNRLQAEWKEINKTDEADLSLTLRDAAENLLIAIGMGWDIEGCVENLRAALAQSGAEPSIDEDAVNTAFDKWAESQGRGYPSRPAFYAGVEFGLRHAQSGAEPVLDRAITAYNAVWEAAGDITSATVNDVRRKAMQAALTQSDAEPPKEVRDAWQRYYHEAPVDFDPVAEEIFEAGWEAALAQSDAEPVRPGRDYVPIGGAGNGA